MIFSITIPLASFLPAGEKRACPPMEEMGEWVLSFHIKDLFDASSLERLCDCVGEAEGGAKWWRWPELNRRPMSSSRILYMLSFWAEARNVGYSAYLVPYMQSGFYGTSLTYDTG